MTIHQNIDSIEAGDPVEITVGGNDPDAWAFDGCIGLVLRAGHNGKQQVATVQIKTGARQGTRVFPVASLRKR